MARSTQEIIDQMNEVQATQPALSGLTSTSQTAIYKLFKYIFAQAVNILEGIMDRKVTDVNNALQYGAAPSRDWIRTKSFEFQYDATVPQIMVLVDGVPQYETIDPSKRIITRAVLDSITGATFLRVAKNEPPEKLSVAELASIQGYFTDTGDGTDMAVGLGWGGQSIAVYSYDPDLLFLEAEIFYNGKFANTIEDECITALETFIGNLGKTSKFRTERMIDALQAVTGFVDIKIKNLSARADYIPWGDSATTTLVDTFEVLEIDYDAEAGYMINETTAGETFADKLTFTAI